MLGIAYWAIIISFITKALKVSQREYSKWLANTYDEKYLLLPVEKVEAKMGRNQFETL